MNQFDSAIKYYNKALKLTPEFDVIYFNLGMNQFMLKDYKACLSSLSKVDIGTNKDLNNIKQQAEYQMKLQADSANNSQK